MRILGISAFFHDSAAALIEDGEIVAAVQEERFTRKRRGAVFPHNAVTFCLERMGRNLAALDLVAIDGATSVEFERKIREELAKHGNYFDWKNRAVFTERTLCCAASAFYPSPFEKACILTMDSPGERAAMSVSIGSGDRLDVIRQTPFPHSLELLYSAFTYYTGFRVNSGEYKVMGLAPFGEPKYAQTILNHLIDLKDDGSFRLDPSYFDCCIGLTRTNAKFHELFGGPPRKPEELLSQHHMDLAASVQAVTEEVLLRNARHLAVETGMKNLCLAGGVALNCVANGKILRVGAFENIWIQPAAGDAGGALGAAYCAYHWHKSQPRTTKGCDKMQGAYLGPEYSQEQIEERLRATGAKFSVLSDEETTAATARALADENAVGWFQGRMEFGPRALGGRTIMGDARSPSMQKTLNLKVKYRESFRPFAPSVLREDVADWFDIDTDSPYMLLVADVLEKRRRKMSAAEHELFGIDKLNIVRSDIPAVTHVDYSARVQTVHADTNPRYHAVISKFKELTGCPVIVNTSFNVRGEPIVCTPEDAFRCFMGTEIEILVVGNCWLEKDDQDPALKLDYKNAFELD